MAMMKIHSLIATVVFSYCCSSLSVDFHLLDIFSLQEASVGGDFLFKTGLDVHEDFVFIALSFHIWPQLAKLSFYTADKILYLGELYAVSAFCVC